MNKDKEIIVNITRTKPIIEALNFEYTRENLDILNQLGVLDLIHKIITIIDQYKEKR